MLIHYQIRKWDWSCFSSPSVLLIVKVHVVIACILGLPYAILKQTSNSKALGQLIYHQELRCIFFLLLKCKLSLPKEKEKQKRLGFTPFFFVFFWTKILYGHRNNQSCVFYLDIVRCKETWICWFVGVLFSLLSGSFSFFFWHPVWRKSHWCPFLKFISCITFAIGKSFLSCLEAINF